MKKLLIISILVMLTVLVAVVPVKATTNEELPGKLYSMGSKYGMTEAEKIKIERYLADYPVTEEQANQVVAKAEEAIKIMEEANATKVSELTKEQKEQLKSIANEAASIVGVTLKFKANSVQIYKNGRLIEEVTSNDGKLAYTGNNVNAVLAVMLVAVVAIALRNVTKKRAYNA